MNAVIKVENLGKKYIIGHQRQARNQTLRDTMAHTARGILQRIRHPLSPNRESIDLEELWALKDVNFEVQQGERIGIIVRNGAGKSTLLKILSRITEPTTGKVRIKGHVSSLLEVGTGFHPELTGRENIFLNGAILGMTRQEIRQKFDEIVAFAELEKFLDTPVKRYSSGMYVRLAFAVAAHLEPEILLVDEVLAVGDANFQKKCLGKMDEVAKGGRTVLFVSHSMDSVLNLCSVVYVIEGGHISARLLPEEGVRCYLTRNLDKSLAGQPRYQLVPRPAIIHNVSVRGEGGRGSTIPAGQGVHFDIELRDFDDISDMRCALIVSNQRNQRVVLFHTRYHGNLILRPSDCAYLLLCPLAAPCPRDILCGCCTGQRT